MDIMPKWADAILIPLISILLAFIISGILIAVLGHNPFEALALMVEGAVGSSYGWGYTLYYATNFIFTGLAVAVAFHARLFNIGGEGQAVLGGLGVALVCLYIPFPHWALALPFAIIGGALFGAAWAFIPAYLQATRGSHIVITTIMFNFIAAALMTYMLVEVLKPEGSMDPATGRFPEATHLPTFQDLFSTAETAMFRGAPANITFFVALIACVVVWWLIWKTRLGFEIRQFGESEPAARYSGISSVKIIVVAMLISGALAGLMSINSTMGEAERLVLNSAEGAGFIGIAVALMGRSHPIGVLLAALLFGFLYQGGQEVSLMTGIQREVIIVIQALVILFTGALDNMVRMPLERLFLMFRRPEPPKPAAAKSGQTGGHEGAA
jgi:simple sugar transport system permease protein